MSETKHLIPFSTESTPNVAGILNQLKCSLVISTYQAGKLIFISPRQNKLIQLPRSFEKPMGVAIAENGERIALANLSEVVVFQNNPTLARNYPPKPNTYDALYLPRLTYHTNPLDIHDLVWVNSELFAINTMFSCIAKIDDRYSFHPIWKPPFIAQIASEDRCHLNGMCVVNGVIRYVTAFSQTDSPKGWRKDLIHTGILMDISTNKILFDDLAMPHSPRWYDGHLYFVLSGTGKVMRCQPVTGKKEEVISLSGFLRGMAIYQGYLFVAHSRVRKESSSFGQLDPKDFDQNAGIYIVEMASGSLVGHIEYHTSVEEIYDVQIIPNAIRPNILNTNNKQVLGLTTPDSTFWGHKKDKHEKSV